MDKAIQHLQFELSKLRAGKASPSMLEDVRVDYYGTPTPLHQLANVNTCAGLTIIGSPLPTGASCAIAMAGVANTVPAMAKPASSRPASPSSPGKARNFDANAAFMSYQPTNTSRPCTASCTRAPCGRLTLVGMWPKGSPVRRLAQRSTSSWVKSG